MKLSRRKRNPRGNMLVFITACTIGLIAALAFFGLGYVRLLGSNSEQKTAVEAAALAAARDLSLIAINVSATNPCYGWVSLSDYAPNTSSTKPTTGDNYGTPVRSINTIIGTLRLDLIIAEQIGDNNLKTIIKYDLSKALLAEQALKTELNRAITAGQVAHDVNGNAINVYLDAENAYKSNQIRMTGSSSYVANSLRLSLNCLTKPAQTNIPVPSCSAAQAVLSSANSTNGKYLSYVDCPYQGSHFMFMGIGTNVTLVDPKTVAAVPSGSPAANLYIPTIVRAEADQHMNSSENSNGFVVHAAACAQPANVTDPRPAPSALSFSFPDGIMPEMTKPHDMLVDNNGARIFNNNSDQAAASYSFSSGGDFPVSGSITDRTWPFTSTTLVQNTGNIFRIGLVDWWQRAGCTLNVASAVSMMTGGSFTTPSPASVVWKAHGQVGSPTIYTISQPAPYPTQTIPNGSIHVYKVLPNNGSITYQTTIIAPIRYAVAGENQLYSENIKAIYNSTIPEFQIGPFKLPGDSTNQTYYFHNDFDCYIRDQIHKPGNGKHGGEPLDCSTVASRPAQTNHPRSSTSLSRQIADRELGSGGTGCWWISIPKGNGHPPIVIKQSDFAETIFPYTDSYYYTYSQNAGGSLVRPTYQTNGMGVDIRFRRHVAPDPRTADALGFTIGYVGEKYDNSIAASPTLPPDTTTTTSTSTTSTSTDTSTSTSTSTDTSTATSTDTSTSTTTTTTTP